MKTNDQLTAYLAVFIEKLVQMGVTEAVISPGSRSTPIAMLMADHPTLKTYVNIDERSAAFFALGIAKASGRPVAMICTSGTATANYFPAIVEAYYSRVPLIVLTADRPHELRGVGAPQAINQIGLYGKYTKMFVEMALPENNLLNYAKTMAAKAVMTSVAAPKGPIHLNFPLRDPLVPNLGKEHLWKDAQGTEVMVPTGKQVLHEEYFQNLFEEIRHVEKGLIICGPMDNPAFSTEVVNLANHLQYPILADPLSQLRTGAHAKENIIDSYDAILRMDQITKHYQPEVVIRFGAMPVSKALTIYLKTNENCRQIVIDGEGRFREPTLTATEMVYCDEVEFCKSICKVGKRNSTSAWLDDWKTINQLTQEVVFQVKDETELSEGKVFYELRNLLPEGSTLFVGNSMPVRDLDTYFLNQEKSIRMMANRGANGIDGVVSTALGASATKTPLVLVIGDLSFYHDLNGLLAAKLHELDVTIIVINNDGGGIFSFLPQAEEKTHFEPLFGTPIGLDFEHVVNMYHGHFKRVQNWDDFRKSVYDGINHKGLHVIEVRTNREENVKKHRILWKNVSQEIEKYTK